MMSAESCAEKIVSGIGGFKMGNTDNQLTCMAGEFLTIGKLFKMGLQTSLTFGNAKGIDIFAKNTENEKIYNVQVKSGKSPFRLSKENIKDDYIFVFIVLNEFMENEEYYIVKGSEIINNMDKFYGSQYKNNKSPAQPNISISSLKEYKDNWSEFNK